MNDNGAINNRISKNAKLISRLLVNLGENPARPGLIKTPQRVAKSYEELLSGYKVNIKSIFTTFDSEKHGGTVRLSNIYFTSLCEHHLLPFFGTVDIVYKLNGKVVGLSKLARLVDTYSKRLQIQERLTNQIAQSLMDNISPIYCSVTIKAEHFCISARGVNKPGCITETNSKLGNYE